MPIQNAVPKEGEPEPRRELWSFTDEDIEAGMLLQAHGLDYHGGGWEETMVKAAAWLSLMDALREHSVIGTGCRKPAENGRPGNHSPETCLREEQEAHAWIADVSSGSEGGARAIQMITEMAWRRWLTMHGSAAAAEMHRRIDVWIHWTCDLYENA